MKMKIDFATKTIAEVSAGYVDSAEKGVVGYGGRLNIRPAYQREFVYDDKMRAAVIESVRRDYPLNEMYWVLNPDGTYELLDGQQRTISICQFVTGAFSIKIGRDNFFFDNLSSDAQSQILNYELKINICSGGTDEEKLAWFEIVNTPGLELTRQELRNTLYVGAWLSSAKEYFSKNGCAAKQAYGNYLKGAANRQEYLETALRWISARDGIEISEYMARQNKNRVENCNELWFYFEDVFRWVARNFPKYRREMIGLDWGIFYNEYGDKIYDAAEFERRTVELMDDDDVTNNRGIYEYLLDGDERHLSIRKFSEKIKRAAYERQNHCCKKCGKHYPIEKMHADHIVPWSKGGRTVEENCQVLCENCNRRKSDV